MATQSRTRPEYDLPTAVTFMFAGIAVGAILTALFFPLTDICAAIRSPVLPPPSPSRAKKN
jgi:hypothetical protein